MRHVVIYRVLYECDAVTTTEAIEQMQRDTGVAYDVVEHSVLNVPCDTVSWAGTLCF